MKRTKESKAQREVWEWKEEAYKEVEDLEPSAAIRKRLKDSLKSAKKMRITPPRLRSRGGRP